ncbi:regulator of G-protein signaling protein-like isoform X2 [Narcine bancroftii]|uniref:regulator of G-protein signaling protein-like isoform X2 n=1 Tax=Narcine bancroftii TaxID=1343680 RepID=UPI003831B334
MNDPGHATILELLNNDIFVDFLNVFLNLPVFGQTPVYVLKDKSWELQPELPTNLTENVDGFLKWLEEHRLLHFLKTDLHLHFILSQLLLDMPVPILTVTRIAAVPQESLESHSSLEFSEDGLSSNSLSSKAQDSNTWLSQEPSKEEAQTSETRDQWLLRKCIGSVRGMKRFRSFLLGTNGAELVEFWIRMERMLQLDETDINQRDQYFTQLRTLQATHLQDGSIVMTTCAPVTGAQFCGSKDIPLSKEHFRTRRDFLAKVQQQALEQLKGYWLPRFVEHCKQSLRKVKEYGAVLWVNGGKGSQGEALEISPKPRMVIKRSEGIAQPYSSKAHKSLLWGLPACKVTAPRPPDKLKAQSGQDCSQHQPSGPQPTPPKQDGLGCLLSPRQLCGSQSAKDQRTAGLQGECVFPLHDSSIPLIKAASMLQCQRFPEVPRQLRYLNWAFSADLLAGGPLAEFLRMRDHLSQLHYLRLWHEMSNFFNVVLSVKDRGSYLLRKILGEKIIDVYLTESSDQYTKLQVETVEQLKMLLPSGQVIPWIFVAQKEICEILQETYDEFLDQEDKSFLDLVAGTQPSDPGRWTQCRELATPTTDSGDPYIGRMARALLLGQACTAMGDTETLTDEDWRLLVTEITANLGSLEISPKPPTEDVDVKHMTFEELALKYPKLAIEELSKNFHQYYKKIVLLGLLNKEILQEKLGTKLNVKHLKVGNKILTRPKGIPRKLADVLTDLRGIIFFQRFLEAYASESPLQFWQAVEKLENLTTASEKKLYAKWIINNFFNKNVNPKELLQCDSPIIKQIMDAIEHGEPVTMNMLLQAQSEVQKSLQGWFELYLKTYSAESEQRINSVAVPKSMHILIRTNRAWKELQKIIRMVKLFLKMLKTPTIHRSFESYLRDEVYNDEENMTISRIMSNVPSLFNLSVFRGLDYGEDYEVTHIKKRVVCNQQIIVNYLVNDLHICMEIQHYVRRSEAAIIMARFGMHDDVYEGLLRAKVEMIIKLFLQADNPPRLRVNILEHERDQIIMGARYGTLQPNLFHSARMAVIVPLLHFWKRFCLMNALKILGQPTRQWRREYIPPNYLKPSPEFHYKMIPVFEGEEFPILRFTLAKGIQMLIPQDQGRSSTAGSSQKFRKNGVKEKAATFSTGIKSVLTVNDKVLQKKPKQSTDGGEEKWKY